MGETIEKDGGDGKGDVNPTLTRSDLTTSSDHGLCPL